MYISVSSVILRKNRFKAAIVYLKIELFYYNVIMKESE